MGPRLNKRQMRELQELEELDKQRAQAVEYASSGEGSDGDEQQQADEPVGRAIQSAFGAVSQGDFILIDLCLPWLTDCGPAAQCWPGRG